MDTKYRLLEIDYWIQKILGISVLLCLGSIVGFTFGILALIPFGAIQVLSGLVFTIAYQDKKKIIYLLIVVAYFVCCFAFLRLATDDNKYLEATKFIGCLLCITPIVLGNWYFRLTAAEYKDLKRQRESSHFENKQILDA